MYDTHVGAIYALNNMYMFCIIKQKDIMDVYNIEIDMHMIRLICSSRCWGYYQKQYNVHMGTLIWGMGDIQFYGI